MNKLEKYKKEIGFVSVLFASTIYHSKRAQ